MASLNTKPGSSSAKAHQTLVIAGKRRGFTLAEIRKMVGGSITKLSAIECSDWITHFTGQGLPNPPGQKKSPYAGKKRSHAIRFITDSQVDQIYRLMLEYFDYNRPQALAWLEKNFKVRDPQDLATAQKAGRIIHVLKEMLARRKAKEASI